MTAPVGPYWAWADLMRRAFDIDLAPIADDLVGLRARRHPDPADRDDPRRHLGEAGA